MAFKSLLIFAVVLSILCMAAAGGLDGGWEPIKNPNDPTVVEIAKFAVAENNKKYKAALVLVSVERGETRVAAGTQYQLVLSIKDSAAARWPPIKYLALVWDKPQEKLRKLIRFYQITN
ncbi:hypothetical protein RD792_000818 [Penstemon davidsonii]|uniref:Cystatin domain-containing protein n=1 Tax=Penstemon davidsonii TaxID=160366 RepID=A0ABR0DMG8_9LAMI|nr:hypothetical protein RD792_000818 [Penstemon davidsonii]